MSLSRTLAAALIAVTPAAAQDLVGFDLSSFGKVVLSRDQMAGDALPEAAFGSYNNEFISAYSPQSVFARIGRSVGRLDVATDAGVFPCTAFLVAEDLLMTNHHCVPGILDNPRAGASAIVGVRFVAGYTREGIAEGTDSYLVNPLPVETSAELDYTLLRVVGAQPGRTWGTLALASADPHDHDPYWIIGHPMGEAQRISREQCRANAPALAEGRLLHTCDTLPGNSGSPVIDASTQLVIGLHNAGSARNSVNYAVPMSAILRASALLAPAAAPAPGGTPAPDPEAEATRALSRALAIADIDARRTALEALSDRFPGSAAAANAAMILPMIAAQPPAAPASPPPAAQAPVADDLAARMAADADVAACDRLAGYADHPDLADIDSARTVEIGDIDAEAAIAACTRALARFPDHPRLNTFLARALFAAERFPEAFDAARKAADTGDPLALNLLGALYANGLGVAKSEETAVDYYRRAAEQGLAVAQSNLAIAYDFGRGLPQSYEQAHAWYLKAAEQGLARAQNNLGILYGAGRGVPKSDETSVEWFRKAAEQGFPPAQLNLAMRYETGRGVARSYEQAADWYRRAADQGHAPAQAELGRLYEDGRGVRQSYDKALEWYGKAAEQGMPEAQVALALMHEAGKGTPASPETAADWFRRAAEQGNAKGQFYLGWLYETGSGVAQSYGQAAEWYRRSAEQGDAYGQNAIGHFHLNGTGVGQSDTTAADWLRRAADQGIAEAQTSLGLMYKRGRGVPMSLETAAEWLRKAADQGDARAQNELGVMYEKGTGVPQDYQRAAALYEQAVAGGNPRAMNNLGSLYERGLGVRQDYDRAADLLIRSVQGGRDWALTRTPNQWTTEMQRAMQRRLRALGVYSGPIDGVMGPQSMQALRSLLPPA